jgi:hypothetical protein
MARSRAPSASISELQDRLLDYCLEISGVRLPVTRDT